MVFGVSRHRVLTGRSLALVLTGSSLLLEFDNNFPPGWRGGSVNHIHTAFRDPQNDDGENVLKRHYEQSHRPATPSPTRAADRHSAGVQGETRDSARQYNHRSPRRKS